MWMVSRWRGRPQFLIDTTNTGWGLHLVTSGDFFMATDNVLVLSASHRSAKSVRILLMLVSPSRAACLRPRTVTRGR